MKALTGMQDNDIFGKLIPVMVVQWQSYQPKILGYRVQIWQPLAPVPCTIKRVMIVNDDYSIVSK